MRHQILHIDSSLSGESGVSAQLGKTFVAMLADTLNAKVHHRHLTPENQPHLSPAAMAAATEGESTLADTLIHEVKMADILVLGVPMYNFGVPSTLKAWFDHIARAGETFRYTSGGPEGLLKNKRAYIITTRGGFHHTKSTDVQTDFLKVFLRFVGITDVQFIYAEGLNMGESVRTEQIEKAQQQLNAIAQSQGVAA